LNTSWSQEHAVVGSQTFMDIVNPDAIDLKNKILPLIVAGWQPQMMDSLCWPVLYYFV